MQPDHKVEYLLRHYPFFMKLQKSVIFIIFHQFDSKRNVAYHQYQFYSFFVFDKNTPMYTFGEIAWIRGRIFTKLLSFFMNLKVCHFYNVSSIRPKIRGRTPSILALSFFGMIIALQCILLEI